MLHAPVDVICEPADIQSFDAAHALHGCNGRKIREREQRHAFRCLRSVQHIEQRADEPALEQRPCQQTCIIQQAGNRNDRKRALFLREIPGDPLRIAAVIHPPPPPSPAVR